MRVRFTLLLLFATGCGRDDGAASVARPAARPAAAPAADPGPGVDEGTGATADEALRDAFRNAVRRVVGAYVDAETQVRDDQIISDQILTYSDGFIEKYERVGSSHEGGVHRVRIRAAVEKRDVVARLKDAKVAVRGVDGEGLFAEAVSSLESEQAAARMIRRVLGDYPANVLTAEVVSKPRVIDKDDKLAKISYDIRVAVDTTRYDQLMKRVAPLLKRASLRSGHFQGIGKEESTSLPTDFGIPLEQKVRVTRSRRFNLDFMYGPKADFQLDAIDYRTQMVVVVNTGRDATDTGTRWEWFHLAKGELFHAGVVVRVACEGTKIADAFPFGRNGSHTLPGSIMPGLSLYTDFGSEGYARQYSGPWDKVVVSPFFLSNRSYAAAFEWTVERTLPLADLRRATEFRCSCERFQQEPQPKRGG